MHNFVRETVRSTASNRTAPSYGEDFIIDRSETVVRFLFSSPPKCRTHVAFGVRLRRLRPSLEVGSEELHRSIKRLLPTSKRLTTRPLRMLHGKPARASNQYYTASLNIKIDLVLTAVKLCQEAYGPCRKARKPAFFLSLAGRVGGYVRRCLGSVPVHMSDYGQLASGRPAARKTLEDLPVAICCD